MYADIHMYIPTHVDTNTYFHRYTHTHTRTHTDIRINNNCRQMNMTDGVFEITLTRQKSTSSLRLESEALFTIPQTCDSGTVTDILESLQQLHGRIFQSISGRVKQLMT